MVAEMRGFRWPVEKYSGCYELQTNTAFCIFVISDADPNSCGEICQ
jgi:hypothetical protein